MTAASETSVSLSVVAPCYNEEAALPSFLDRMEAVCRRHAGGAYEILLVNDGSRDRTWACIQAFAATRPGVVGIDLSRNHGHQLAVTAGLVHARGRRVLIIDADLQDPPELLVDMMARMDDGAEVVYGRRRRRAGETRLKLLTAHLFYRLLSGLSEVEIPRDTGDFRLMNRRMVDLLNAMPEQDRFLRGMVAWLGGRQEEVLYDRPSRAQGVTGYTLWKMVRLAVGGLTSFSTAPLRLASLLALAGAGLGGLMALYAVIGWLSGRAHEGWTSLALLITVFSTAQLACMAILGAYVGRIFNQSKGRPLFLIGQVARGPLDIGLSPAGFDTLDADFTPPPSFRSVAVHAAEFDSFADEYTAIHRRNIEISGEDPEYFARYKIEELRRRWTALRGCEPSAVLDFGCGVGNSLPHLAELFPASRIAGIDVSEKSLAFARTRAPAAALHLYDGLQIEIEPQSQDLVFSACVFHHIEPQARDGLLHQIHRLLRPGGALVIFEHNPFNPVTRHVVATCPFDENAVLLSPGELAGRQRRAGFSRVRTRYVGFFPAKLKAFRRLEPMLCAAPVGAQYYTFADR